MQQKKIYVDGVGEVFLTSRKGSKSLRISLKPDGRVVLNVPRGINLKFAQEFLKSKSNWIALNKIQPKFLYPNQQIGKAHRIVFKVGTGTRASARVANNTIKISSPTDNFHDPQVQSVAKKAAKKSLFLEAEMLLPQRLQQISDNLKLPYKSLQIKHHKTRWGVCDNQKNLTLNCFLMQLPWGVIDYVIVHELAHTVYMSHSKKFWEFVELNLPNAKVLRTELKNYKPSF
jgi:predicted metal-dependent hydrolase